MKQSNHYRKSQNKPTERAFLPHIDEMPDGTKVWMTSVFRIRGLTTAGVWAIADENGMGSGSAQPAFGIGTVFAREVSGVGLKIHPDDRPPRHALLLGWDSEKDVRKRVAQDLAEVATAILR